MRRLYSEVFFQRVRVTAAKDSNTEDAFVLEKKESKEEQEGKQKPKVTRLYTLAVSPEQLQYLNRAKNAWRCNSCCSRTKSRTNRERTRTS